MRTRTQAPLKFSNDDAVICHALAVLEKRARYGGDPLNNPSAVRDYLRLRLAGLQHELFACVFLDAQNRVIEFEEMFRGTLTQTSVYPREVVKTALKHNAAATIFAHNHPSGVTEPSSADLMLTQNLKRTLDLVDIKVLDHSLSRARRGCHSQNEGFYERPRSD